MIPHLEPDLPDTDLDDTQLHDLFDAATAGLSPLPDLVPEAHRIVRRRRLATHSLGAALSAALAIGVGTFALDSPGRSDGHTGIGVQARLSASTESSASMLADYKNRAAALLQGIWPVTGETIRPAPGEGGSFEVRLPNGKVYPITLDTGWTAHEGIGSIQVEHSTDSGLDGVDEPEAAIICYRAHVMVQLFVFNTPATLISDTQLHQMQTELLAAPGLIELAQADHQVLGVPGSEPSTTPPATPSQSVSPTVTPSQSPPYSPLS